MKEMENKTKVLNWFDWFLIFGVIVSNLTYMILTKSNDWLGAVASIAGLLCVVLVAKGSIWNYLFGLVNVSLYAWIAYKTAIYGDAVLNAFYYLPMQFIGYYQWRKRGAGIGDKESSVVRARRLSNRQRITIACGSAALIVTVGFVLQHFDDPQPFKDSTTTVLSIIAQCLMALAFMEQWVLWVIVNAVSVGMWTVCVFRGDAHSGAMLIMWIFYLMNAINGLRVWIKLSSAQSGFTDK